MGEVCELSPDVEIIDCTEDDADDLTHAQCVIVGDFVINTLDRVWDELIFTGDIKRHHQTDSLDNKRRQVIEFLITLYFKHKLEERRSLHLQVLKACIEVKPESSYSDDQNKQVSHDNVKTGLAGSDKQSGRNTNSATGPLPEDIPSDASLPGISSHNSNQSQPGRCSSVTSVIDIPHHGDSETLLSEPPPSPFELAPNNNPANCEGFVCSTPVNGLENDTGACDDELSRMDACDLSDNTGSQEQQAIKTVDGQVVKKRRRRRTKSEMLRDAEEQKNKVPKKRGRPRKRPEDPQNHATVGTDTCDIPYDESEATNDETFQALHVETSQVSVKPFKQAGMTSEFPVESSQTPSHDQTRHFPFNASQQSQISNEGFLTLSIPDEETFIAVEQNYFPNEEHEISFPLVEFEDTLEEPVDLSSSHNSRDFMGSSHVGDNTRNLDTNTANPNLVVYDTEKHPQLDSSQLANSQHQEKMESETKTTQLVSNQLSIPPHQQKKESETLSELEGQTKVKKRRGQKKKRNEVPRRGEKKFMTAADIFDISLPRVSLVRLPENLLTGSSPGTSDDSENDEIDEDSEDDMGDNRGLLHVKQTTLENDSNVGDNRGSNHSVEDYSIDNQSRNILSTLAEEKSAENRVQNGSFNMKSTVLNGNEGVLMQNNVDSEIDMFESVMTHDILLDNDCNIPQSLENVQGGSYQATRENISNYGMTNNNNGNAMDYGGIGMEIDGTVVIKNNPGVVYDTHNATGTEARAGFGNAGHFLGVGGQQQHSVTNGNIHSDNVSHPNSHNVNFQSRTRPAELDQADSEIASPETAIIVQKAKEQIMMLKNRSYGMKKAQRLEAKKRQQEDGHLKRKRGRPKKVKDGEMVTVATDTSDITGYRGKQEQNEMKSMTNTSAAPNSSITPSVTTATVSAGSVESSHVVGDGNQPSCASATLARSDSVDSAVLSAEDVEMKISSAMQQVLSSNCDPDKQVEMCLNIASEITEQSARQSVAPVVTENMVAMTHKSAARENGSSIKKVKVRKQSPNGSDKVMDSAKINFLGTEFEIENVTEDSKQEVDVLSSQNSSESLEQEIDDEDELPSIRKRPARRSAQQSRPLKDPLEEYESDLPPADLDYLDLDDSDADSHYVPSRSASGASSGEVGDEDDSVSDEELRFHHLTLPPKPLVFPQNERLLNLPRPLSPPVSRSSFVQPGDRAAPEQVDIKKSGAEESVRGGDLKIQGQIQAHLASLERSRPPAHPPANPPSQPPHQHVTVSVQPSQGNEPTTTALPELPKKEEGIQISTQIDQQEANAVSSEDTQANNTADSGPDLDVSGGTSGQGQGKGKKKRKRYGGRSVSKEVVEDDPVNYKKVTEVTPDMKVTDLYFKLPGKLKLELMCRLCGYHSMDTARMKVHLRVHTGERPFKCSVCPREFIEKAHLQRHLLVHADMREVPCSCCSKMFRDKSAMQRHNIRVHLKNGDKMLTDKEVETLERQYRFQCRYCPNKFFNQKDCEIHENVHTGHKPFSCDYAGCGFATRWVKNLKEHVKVVHLREKDFQCPTCGLKFVSRSRMKQHRRKVHDFGGPMAKTHVCEFCGMAFKYLKNLKMHIPAHSSKVFKCSYCDFSTKWERYLKDHEMRHKGERNYQCDLCGLHFTHINSLRAHQIRHQKPMRYDKAYTCSVCDKRFASEKWLQNHIQSHVTGHYECPYCDAVYDKKSGLKSHMTRHKKYGAEYVTGVARRRGRPPKHANLLEGLDFNDDSEMQSSVNDTLKEEEPIRSLELDMNEPIVALDEEDLRIIGDDIPIAQTLSTVHPDLDDGTEPTANVADVVPGRYSGGSSVSHMRKKRVVVPTPEEEVQNAAALLQTYL